MCQAAGALRFQLNNGGVVMEVEVATGAHGVFPPPMVWKGRTEVSEQVYRLERGPRHHSRVGF